MPIEQLEQKENDLTESALYHYLHFVLPLAIVSNAIMAAILGGIIFLSISTTALNLATIN
jgi:hypothetical protein